MSEINVHLTEDMKKCIEDNIESYREEIRKRQKSLNEEIDDELLKLKLKLRNLLRMLKMDKDIYCYQKKANLKQEEYISCWMCPYGHFLECHYPFSCNSMFCHHYNYQDE